MYKHTIIFSISITLSVAVTILGMIIIEPDLFTKEVLPEPPAPLGVPTPEDTFYWPRGVAVNGSNYIFVADTQNSRGQIFFPNGTFHKTFGFPGNDRNDGSLNKPYGITVSPAETIYVSNTFNNSIKVFSSSGTYLGTLPFPAGTTNGTLYYPSSLAFNGTTSYIIADTYNNRLQVFNDTITNDFIQTIPAK